MAELGDLNSTISYWHWIGLGIVLVTVEAFVPGAFFLGMGFSALIVGGALFALDSIDWKWQLFDFALLSAISIVVLRHWINRSPIESDQPLLNQRAARYVGRQFHLLEPIVNGRGKIKVDDSIWRVEGADSPQGSQVKVTGVDGTVLQVEPVEGAA